MYKMRLLFLVVFVYPVLACISSAFSVAPTTTTTQHRRGRPGDEMPSSTSSLAMAVNTNTPPTRTSSSSSPGLGQTLLNLALESPVWKYLLVPQARKKIVDTAQENGVPWNKCYAWISSQPGPWQEKSILDTTGIPAYYQKSFHAYEEGNLCWDAALEVEIASCAVGARNFPKFGPKGEDAFRGAFANAFQNELQVHVPDQAVVVDLGCGTGMSTRPLAAQYPQAKQIIGFDLSPYFIQVGKKLLELSPRSFTDGGSWVNTINFDERIDYRVGDAADTGLPDESVDVVNVQFVVHELPVEVSIQIMNEAYRILKPGGQLWVGEMDFQSPGYAAQRSNALLFSLIRSTEPYLDVYAEGQTALREHIGAKFATTRVTAATGRHYALCAIKHVQGEDASVPGILQDDRYDKDGVYRVEDTHLKVWKNKA